MGVSALGLSTMTSQVAAAAEAADVTELSGRERADVLSEAVSDSETRAIFTEMAQSDLRPNQSEAQVTHTESEDGSWDSVVIPFELAGGSELGEKEEAYLVWTNADAYDNSAAGFDIGHDGTHWLVDEYTVEGGQVVSEYEELENFLGCSSLNWSCILSAAGAYAGTIGACGTCATGVGFFACASCVGTILGSAGLTMGCSWCNHPIDDGSGGGGGGGGSR